MLLLNKETNFSTEKLVYIVIPVHNRCELTLNCLRMLCQIEGTQHFSIVVVDDGSTDGTGEAISNLYPNIIVLSGDGTLWWTGAIALGMEYAYKQGADYIIWLNDDCELGVKTLQSLIDFCRDNPNAIAGAQGFLKGSDHQISFGGKQKTWKGYRFINANKLQVLPCDLLSGNVVCIPRAVVDQIGFPDPRITPHYGGDSLYFLHAQKAGFRMFVDARYPAQDLPGESVLYPSSWLTCAGEPSYLLKLVFNQYSGLSWKLWLRFNWEAYGIWGVIMFLKKYSSILLLSFLRLAPLSIRKRLSGNP